MFKNKTLDFVKCEVQILDPLKAFEEIIFLNPLVPKKFYFYFFFLYIYNFIDIAFSKFPA